MDFKAPQELPGNQYLIQINQCWLIVNQNKFQWDSNQKYNNFHLNLEMLSTK